MGLMREQVDELNAVRHSVVSTDRKIPAWFLSTIVHLVLLIVLVLVVQQVPRKTAAPPRREVAIALVQRDANDTTRYLTEEDTGQQSTQPVEAQSPAAPVPNTPPPSLPEIKLPATQELTVGQKNAAGLVAVPSMTGRPRRPVLPGLNDAAILAEEAARHTGKADRGSPGRLALFGGESIVGHSFIFVIDRSKSMGADGLGALSAAAHELDRELRSLQPRHKFQIIAYNHTPLYMKQRNLLDATPENISRVSSYFARLAAYGATAHETALLSALRRNPDVIVFLTDGGDPYLNDAQLERIQSRAGTMTSIHCIQFGFGPPKERDNFMQRLARQNRGGYRYVDMSRWRKE